MTLAEKIKIEREEGYQEGYNEVQRKVAEKAARNLASVYGLSFKNAYKLLFPDDSLESEDNSSRSV